MYSEFFANLKVVMFYSTLPGAAGGIVCFLLALKKDHYRNNKYLVKFTIEVAGAMLTASFVTALITSQIYKLLPAFLIGVAWSNIIQMIRYKITKIVEAALGEIYERGKN